jgi:hypothetical protein
VLFKQYHLRRLDEAFLLVTARSATSTPRSPGSAQVIVVYSLGPSCASILASAPDKALPQPTRWGRADARHERPLLSQCDHHRER